VRGKCN